jgi:hypothetical protein
MPFNKPCLVCGTLSREPRCPEHKYKKDPEKQKAKDADPIRKAKKRALYNNPLYRKQRAEMLATATHCHLCGKAFQYGDKIEADHLIPTNPLSPLAPAHRLCNQRRGNKPIQQQQ